MKSVFTLILRKVLFLLLCLIILVAGYAVFGFSLEKSYREFDEKEQEAIPLFDALNEKILNELPPLPFGTIYIRQYSDGIVYPHKYLHGRRLNIEAETSMTAKDVENYYKSFLLENGWEIINEDLPIIGGPGGVKEEEMSYSIAFRRGTSCIEINTPPMFWIIIWHDFAHQTFTPPLPNSTYRWLREAGLGQLISCP